MNNENGHVMREYILDEWVKYIVLKIGMFSSEIIDEKNFCASDEFGIMKFKQQYIWNDDCVVVKIDM